MFGKPRDNGVKKILQEELESRRRMEQAVDRIRQGADAEIKRCWETPGSV